VPLRNEPSHTGTLYIVATPLGNLEDITLRAIRILRESGAIACEDTRRASILLRHLDIGPKKLVSYHSFNEPRAVKQIIGLLEEGTDVSLTTDAGTPVISDPGYTILQAVYERGMKVIPVPGPSALTAALSACPLPSSSFHFSGFLPHKKGRRSRIDFLCSLGSTFVLYESPFRIMQLLDELEERIPEAQVFIAREMTKIHEEYIAGSIAETRAHLAMGKAKGEFVIVVSPEAKKSTQPEEHHADHH
jgi:16S rRNA (cytidine1402-2'-O)-methyltransferase